MAVYNNRNRVLTSDPTFSAGLLAYLGEDIVLPDHSVIRAIVHDKEATVAGGAGAEGNPGNVVMAAPALSANIYKEVLYARIPTSKLGSLAAKQVVTYDGHPHYVSTLQPTGKGWTTFRLERQ